MLILNFQKKLSYNIFAKCSKLLRLMIMLVTLFFLFATVPHFSLSMHFFFKKKAQNLSGSIIFIVSDNRLFIIIFLCFYIVRRNGKIVWKHGSNWPFNALMLRKKLHQNPFFFVVYQNVNKPSECK